MWLPCLWAEGIHVNSKCNDAQMYNIMKSTLKVKLYHSPGQHNTIDEIGTRIGKPLVSSINILYF